MFKFINHKKKFLEDYPYFTFRKKSMKRGKYQLKLSGGSLTSQPPYAAFCLYRTGKMESEKAETETHKFIR